MSYILCTFSCSGLIIHCFKYISGASSSLNHIIPEKKKQMASYSYISGRIIFVVIYVLAGAFVPAYARNFSEEVRITWGHGRGKILNRGKLLTLSLDNSSGSGFESKNEYLFGKIDMQIKLVPDDSAGTVAAFFLKSPGSAWDEIDFEFLGNLSGDPYTVHTNVFTGGNGNREQQFRLWFDPSAKFHTYSILWNKKTIVFFVNGTPIREYRNLGSKGVAFPKSKPMRVYSSLWNADDWATRGGLVKTNWTQAPFIATYRNYNADACAWSSRKSSCSSKSSSTWLYKELDAPSKQRLKWVQKNFMIYNYCTDIKRFPKGLPPECLEK